jgi:hypothetical protein
MLPAFIRKGGEGLKGKIAYIEEGQAAPKQKQTNKQLSSHMQTATNIAIRKTHNQTTTTNLTENNDLYLGTRQGTQMKCLH